MAGHLDWRNRSDSDENLGISSGHILFNHSCSFNYGDNTLTTDMLYQRVITEIRMQLSRQLQEPIAEIPIATILARTIAMQARNPCLGSWINELCAIGTKENSFIVQQDLEIWITL